MAPFNTHFLVAEKLWPELPGPWQPYYGQFCFGCTAPDVDKVSASLTQKDTHFFDRTGEYEYMASHRSAAFVAGQAGFLSRPFAELRPSDQAFVLGYLCHLCVDEVSKHMWRWDTWQHFKSQAIGSAFAALDEVARAQIRDYPAITGAICGLQPLSLAPRIPAGDLAAFHRGVCRFVRAGDTQSGYLALVDLFDRPTPEQRRERQETVLADLPALRGQVHWFHMDRLVRASLAHSHRRLAELIENRPSQPGYPDVPAL